MSKFVGVPYKKGTGTEALLDIEFMMGVAPGVATEVRVRVGGLGSD